LSLAERNRIYDLFGRNLHLLQDMANPSHTNNEIHLDATFEDFVRDHWNEIVSSKAFLERVNVNEYRKANCGGISGLGIWAYMHELAKMSKGYTTEGALTFFKGQEELSLYDQELMNNVNDLIPEAIKYTACYIDAIFDYINDPSKRMNDPY